MKEAGASKFGAIKMGAFKVYKLTGEGKRVAKIPSGSREPILDHLHEFKTATQDDLLAIEDNARSKLRDFVSRRLITEVS